MAKVTFCGPEIFITDGDRAHHVYPTWPGTYWVNTEHGAGPTKVDTGVLIVDDFGNLVDGFHGAAQRQLFRQVLH